MTYPQCQTSIGDPIVGVSKGCASAVITLLHLSITMKPFVSTLFYITILSLWTASNAFVVVRPAALHQKVSSSMLHMGGFLEGKGKKITVREDEDAAMWVEEPASKKKEPKKSAPAAKKAATAKGKSEPKGGAFKFPWQK